MKNKSNPAVISNDNETNDLSQPIVIERFKTISEIVSDQIFIKNVMSTIDDLRNQRLNRPEPREGFRYRRDWYYQMSDAGNFNANYFVENIENIWLKKSSITSATRKVIDWVCGDALRKTLEHYASLDADKITSNN